MQRRSTADECWIVEADGERYAIFVAPSAIDLSLLTAAEGQVARLVMEGLSNREIGRRRGSSVRTIVNQLARIYRKLGVGSRRELRARATV